MMGLTFAPTREWRLLADLYDAFAKAHFKKPKPYPRPWDTNKSTMRPAKHVTQEQVIAALRFAGHHGALPGQAAEPLKRDRRGRLHDERGRFLPNPAQPDVKEATGV